MAEMGLNVQQQGDGNGSDSTTRTAAGTRMGELFTAEPGSLYNRWLRAGKVFQGQFATEGGTATIENNTAIDLTEPFLLLDVPSSKILVPLFVKIAPAVVWETGDEIVVYTSDTLGFSAGGAAMDVRNMAAVSSLDSALGSTALTSAVDGDSVLTMAAATNVRLLDVHHHITGNLAAPYIYNAINGQNPMVMIHGVGSFAVMCARTTTTVEVLYTVMWAELDKSELVNS